MKTGFARISQLARKPGTYEYRQAVREFVGKMGGPFRVLQEIAQLELDKERGSLFEEFPQIPENEIKLVEVISGGERPARQEETLANAM